MTRTLKRTLWAVLVGLLAFTTVAATAQALDVARVKKKTIVFNNRRYFRGTGVHMFDLVNKKRGSADRWRSFRGNYKGRIAKQGPFSVSWKQTSKSDIGAGVRFMKKGGASGSLSQRSGQSADVKLLSFRADLGEIRDFLNSRAGKSWRDQLANKDASRMVGAVLVAVEGRFARQFERCAGIQGKADSRGFSIDLGAKGCAAGKGTLTVPENTVIGYGLVKVTRWKNRGKSNRRVLKVALDWKN